MERAIKANNCQDCQEIVGIYEINANPLSALIYFMICTHVSRSAISNETHGPDRYRWRMTTPAISQWCTPPDDCLLIFGFLPSTLALTVFTGITCLVSKPPSRLVGGLAVLHSQQLDTWVHLARGVARLVSTSIQLPFRHGSSKSLIVRLCSPLPSTQHQLGYDGALAPRRVMAHTRWINGYQYGILFSLVFPVPTRFLVIACDDLWQRARGGWRV